MPASCSHHRSMTPRRGRVPRMVAVACFVAVILAVGWACDDAFVSFRVVRQVWSGEGPVWNPGWRVQVFTHPLWMAALLVLQPITDSPWLSAMALSAACAAGSGWLILHVFASRRAAAVLAFAVLVSSKALVEFSTSGLETPLTVVLLLALVAALDRRALRWAGWLAGLLLLNRLDSAVWVGVLLASWPLLLRERLRTLCRAAVLPGTWLLVAAVIYGSPWPNAAIAKGAVAVPFAWRVGQGLALLQNSVRWDPVLLPLAAAASVVAGVRSDRTGRALVIAALAGMLYVVAVGGDFMSGRFVLVPAALALLAGLRAIHMSDVPNARLIALAVVVFTVGLFNPRGPLRLGPEPTVGELDVRGIADERTFAAGSAGVAAWLRGTTRFGDAGSGAPLVGQVQVIAGAGGAGFGAAPGLLLVDELAITDPFLARLPVRFTGGRVGHLRRPLPDGYLASLGDGENQLADPDAARCFSRVQDAATRPIGSAVQLAAAWRLTLFGCSDLWHGRWLDPAGTWHTPR